MKLFCFEEGIASVEQIDEAMKPGTNQPMGPLTLADFIGLDTCLAIMKVLYEASKQISPLPLLVKYVEAAGLEGRSWFIATILLFRNTFETRLKPRFQIHISKMTWKE